MKKTKPDKNKKLIAPIVITVLIIVYLLGYAGLFLLGAILIHPLLAVLGLIVPVALAGVAIHVLLQRVEEIEKGEEDDLSKY